MKIFAVILLFLLSHMAYSQDSRWIDLEWEAVPEARQYEIELFQMEGEKVLPRGKYKTDSAQWSHAVPPGKYFLRLRSIDSRGVPGEWSSNIPLKVRMQNPLLLRPAPSDKISDPLVNFEWGPVEGAANYQLVVRNKAKDVIHNSVVPELKSSVYLEKLDEIQWAVFALEKDEEAKPAEEWTESSFRNFARVGGVLEAPKVGITIGDKVIFSWEKVRAAQYYEVDYLPPPGSEKNRRFKLKNSPLAFASSRLKEGITTLTIKSMAEGYQESNKSIIKVSKSGDKAVIEDIIQGREVTDIKGAPTKTFFRNELYLGVALAQFSYESENIDTDTRLAQEKLTGLGFNAEWNSRPTLNSLNRKLDISILNLSSGVDSGFANRFSYTWNKERKGSSTIFSYGGGLSTLMLPAFMGNRFNNKIEVESSTSIGPEIQLGFQRPLSDIWEIQGALIAAYHPIFLSSGPGSGEAFPYLKGLIRAERYYTDKQAFYSQLDYQSWMQKWEDDSSDLSGVTLSFGLKTGF